MKQHWKKKRTWSVRCPQWTGQNDEHFSSCALTRFQFKKKIRKGKANFVMSDGSISTAIKKPIFGDLTLGLTAI